MPDLAFPVALAWDHRLDAPAPKPAPEFVAVEAFVGQELSGPVAPDEILCFGHIVPVAWPEDQVESQAGSLDYRVDLRVPTAFAVADGLVFFFEPRAALCSLQHELSTLACERSIPACASASRRMVSKCPAELQ